MSVNLPYGSGLGACNKSSITALTSNGFEVIDGGVAKCRKLDSKFYDILVSMGYRGGNLSKNLEADWIVSKFIENNDFIFSYINPIAGSANFAMTDGSFSISGKNVTAIKLDDGIQYKIKVGPSAAKNISYIFQNKDSL